MDEMDRRYQEYLALRQKSKEEQNQDGISAGKAGYHGEQDWFGAKENQNKTRQAGDGQEGLSRRERERRDYLAARKSAKGHRAHDFSSGYKKTEKPVSVKEERKFSRKARRHGIAVNDSYRASGDIYDNNGDRVHRPGGRRKKKKRGPAVRIFFILLLACAVMAFGGGILAVAALSSMENVPIDRDSIAINREVDTQLSTYRNIAVLGTDARAGEEDTNSRSDAIIIASINTETDEVKMFSVYRDTMLDVGDQGLDKVTHAYSYGGAQQSLYTLNKNLDLNIDEVVVINWKTVADTIDSVGGIDIDVQESEVDEMNKYIPETAHNVDGPDDRISEAGKQTLNGVQAVTYSRIRKDALTGDYRRNERMKIVFSETFKKVRSAGFLKMFNVARNVLPEIKTNLSTKDVIGLMTHFKSYDMTDSTTGFPYEVGSWTGYGGAGYAWYGPPVNLADNVSKLHGQFFGQKGYTPTDTVREISNSISYLTGIY